MRQDCDILSHQFCGQSIRNTSFILHICVGRGKEETDRKGFCTPKKCRKISFWRL